MSLLSQTDRQMVIEALEFYIHNMKQNDGNVDAIRSYQTLLNWINIEYNKNE